MSAIYAVLVGTAVLLIVLGVRAFIHWRRGTYDYYWSFDRQHPDVPKVTRDNITEICHRLRVPPPSRL